MSPNRHDQSGSSLILALAFILATGLGIGALLSFLHAGFGASTAVSDQGRDMYAADAAIEAAIAQLRADKTQGVAGSCGPFVTSSNGRTVEVLCTPIGDSRATYSVGGTAPAGVPAGALVALQAGGVEIRNNSSKTLTIGGDVLSNGPVATQNGTVAVAGAVRAPSCTGSGSLITTATPATPLTCDTSNATPASDPGWNLAGVSQPPLVTSLGGGHCNGAPVPAGTYVNAALWNNLVSGCNGTLTYSGIYYLDFVDPTPCGTASTTTQWCVGNANVSIRAGTVTGGACTGGALFVLGGTTTITIRAGTLSLCGVTPVANGPTLSVFAKSPPAAPLPGPTTGTTTLVPTVAKSTGNPSYAPEANATTINSVVATAKDSHNGANPTTRTATITLSSLTGAAAVPANATITKVTARVAHRETTTGTPPSTPATVTGLTVTVNGVTVPVATRATLGTDSVVIPFSPMPSAATLAATTIRYDATAVIPKDATFTSDLDGIELVLDYTVPAVVPPAPWGTLTCLAPPCTVLDTDGNNTRTGFHGTIYAPTSHVRVQPVNDGGASFTRGIVARQIELHVPAALSGSSNLEITLPGPVGATSKQRDGRVTLTAKIAGDPRIRISTEVLLPEGPAPTAASVSRWTVR